MPAPTNARHNAVFLVALLAAQLVLMSASARRSGGASVLEDWIRTLSSPGVVVAQAIAGTLHGAVSEIGDLFIAHARNDALESEVRRLRHELVRFREAEPENRRLRQLLGMREELVPQSIAASVVTSHLNGQTRMIVVDRGRSDGVVPDLPVVAWGGAVGRVVDADRWHAKVRLLTDANSGVAGVVQRSRAQGIVQGRAHAALDMLYVPRFADVIHGDRVVTSGIDGIFPRGFGIGRVSSIQTDADGAQTIQLAPELDYRSLEEVLVLVEPTDVGRDEAAGEQTSR